MTSKTIIEFTEGHQCFTDDLNIKWAQAMPYTAHSPKSKLTINVSFLVTG